MEKKPKVLFLSMGNTTRSQMAEGFLHSIAGERFIAVSAGIEPGELNPMTREVMEEAGVDISGQKAKDAKSSLQEHFAYVITVSDDARERAPVFPFTQNLLHWNLEDPSLATGSKEERRGTFLRVRDQVAAKVRDFVNEHPQSEPASPSPRTATRRAR
jgi:arsenate reductase (thioredoxin)